jgi:hypothetical protein
MSGNVGQVRQHRRRGSASCWRSSVCYRNSLPEHRRALNSLSLAPIAGDGRAGCWLVPAEGGSQRGAGSTCRLSPPTSRSNRRIFARQTCGHPFGVQSGGNILMMFCGRLVGDEPVQIAALADHGQSVGAPLIRHFVVSEITERHADNTPPFAGHCRLAVPSIWDAAGCFAGAPTWTTPLYAAISRIFLRFGVAVVTCGATLVQPIHGLYV